MSEEIIETLKPDPCCGSLQPKVRPKRDIFKFDGDKTTAINLEHVTQIFQEKNKITFNFDSVATYIELESEEAAKNGFNQILGIWSSHVGEQ